MDNIPRFKAGTFEDGQHSVVGNCNGFSMEERWKQETPAFADAILKRLKSKDTIVVDYGCGVGRLAKEILSKAPGVSVIGVDASPDELKLAREYINDSRFTTIIPHELAHKVDLVYCVYVLQHVPAIELREALQRIHYYLNDGGTFVYCSSDYRMAINAGGGFTDDRHLGVDIRQEIARYFDEVGDLWETYPNELVRKMVTGEGCPAGSISHPAKVYRKKKLKVPYFNVGPADAPSSRNLTKDGKRKLILRNRLSPGDILVMTCALRSLHKAYPGKFITDIDSPCNEIFENSPYVTKLNGDGQIIDMHYPVLSGHGNEPGAGVSGRHFSDGHRKYLETILDLKIPRTGLLPDIFLSQDEQLWPSPVLKEHGFDGQYWVINAGAKSDFPLKQYHRYQEVVDEMAKRMPGLHFIQIGAAEHNHAPLECVLDMRGKTNHRELFRVISKAEGVLTCVSYPMHVAAAFQKPCVVVAGGRESTRWELYPNHRFLYVNGAIPCASFDGCWKSKLEDCMDAVETDKGRQPHCMDLITPYMVADAIELYYKGGVLQYEKETINV